MFSFQTSRRLADRLFSKLVRYRDNFICCRCQTKHEKNSKGLHASHYFSRARENTRFDFENVDSLCLACHRQWGHGDGRHMYTYFKKRQLGDCKYKELYKRATTPGQRYEKQKSDLQRIAEFREKLKQYE